MLHGNDAVIETVQADMLTEPFVHRRVWLECEYEPALANDVSLSAELYLVKA